MSKSKQTSSTDKLTNQARRYNPVVVQELADKHGFTKMFIRQCIRGDRTSITAETIAKEYKLLVAKVNDALKDNSK